MSHPQRHLQIASSFRTQIEICIPLYRSTLFADYLTRRKGDILISDLYAASFESWEGRMKRPSQIRLLVHCVLSDVAMGCAEQGEIFDVGHSEPLRTTCHNLIDGDHLAIKIQIPDERRPVSVSLAKVNWIQGERFGVEFLVMDADERVRLNSSLEAKLPLELEFQDWHAELTIKAVD